MWGTRTIRVTNGSSVQNILQEGGANDQSHDSDKRRTIHKHDEGLAVAFVKPKDPGRDGRKNGHNTVLDAC